MFETDFASSQDENIGFSANVMEFEPTQEFPSSWDDGDRPLAQNFVSPSSLRSYTTPRKAIRTPSVNSNGFEEVRHDPSPRGVIVVDQNPFRGRFASAALISQKANAKAHMEQSTSLFRSQEEDVSSPLSDKSIGPLSPNDDSYVSFGDQSVFSDITDNEAAGSISSASRELRRKARESKKLTSPRQQLFKVQEEVEDIDRRGNSVIKEAPSKASGENRTTASEEPGSEIGKKLSNRLASFFANRSLSRPRSNRDDADQNVGDQTGGDLIGRSLTVPRERPRFVESPVRSNASGSSGGYVGWPGTLDRNGDTVVETSSFSTVEDVVIPSPRESLSANRRVPAREEQSSTSGEKNRLTEESVRIDFINSSRRESLYANRRVPAREEQPSMSGEKNRLTEESVRVDFINSSRRESFSANSRTPAREEQPSMIGKKDHHTDESAKIDFIKSSRVNESTRREFSKPVVNAPRSRVAELKRQFEQKKELEEIVDLDVKPKTDSWSDPKPSDYHLAAAIAKAKLNTSVQSHANHDRSMSSEHSFEFEEQNLNHSFPGAKGRGSSPHHQRRVSDQMHKAPPQIDTSASLRRVQSAGRSVSSISRKTTPTYSLASPSTHSQSSSIRLSEAALKQKDLSSPSLQNVAHGANVKGYRGFINKTADVPNLMDDMESVTSASTMGTNRRHDRSDVESDVFDGVSSVHSNYIQHVKTDKRESPTTQWLRSYVPNEIPEETEMNVVQLKKTISSIQTTAEAFEQRRTSVEFDAALTESDTDYERSNDRRSSRQSSNAIIPGHYDPIIAQNTRPQIADDSSHTSHDSTDSVSQSYSEASFVSYDLSEYAIDSTQVSKLVKAYRNFSQLSNGSAQFPSEEEDSKKAFALFEMRSRIMETDLERGFDRAGGTVCVDDIVLTSFYKASCRVRDAVIVSKAWRDGASPQDARTALNLTRGHHHYIKRSSRIIHSTGSASSDSQGSFDTTCSHLHISLERVGWIDDTEFSLIRYFGATNLRGSDIFTVGDCQSMLLKLTHEQCEVSLEYNFSFGLLPPQFSF